MMSRRTIDIGTTKKPTTVSKKCRVFSRKLLNLSIRVRRDFICRLASLVSQPLLYKLSDFTLSSCIQYSCLIGQDSSLNCFPISAWTRRNSYSFPTIWCSTSRHTMGSFHLRDPTGSHTGSGYTNIHRSLYLYVSVCFIHLYEISIPTPTNSNRIVNTWVIYQDRPIRMGTAFPG